MKMIEDMKNLLFCFIFLFFICCNSQDKREITQKKRDNVIRVKDRVNEIQTGEVLIGRIAPLFIVDNYLIIGDPESNEKVAHLFDKNIFDYITSIGDKGQGPGEIVNMGYIGTSKDEKSILISDHGKQKIFAYKLDSVFINSNYKPYEEINIDPIKFPSEYLFINDTLCICRIIERIGSGNFEPTVGIWNIITGEIETLKYRHPQIDKRRINFVASIKDSIYIECYSNYDLLTMCNFEGELLFNIYGPKWKKDDKMISYYHGIEVGENIIFALYSGENDFLQHSNGTVEQNFPESFLIFDFQGNYLKTLDIGYKITYFCYDKDNNRLLLSFDDIIQFGYLDLDDLI